MLREPAYIPSIGLEVHAQLSTESKLFCGCRNAFGGSMNQQTCPVCLGFPGALPVVNGKAIELAAKAAMALGCRVQSRSAWARKNYFYPDLPKGYQITQDRFPIAWGGALEIATEGSGFKAELLRLHIEEDAGKSIHDDNIAGDYSLVDFNRGGTPLIEIVSAPCFHQADMAVAYLKELRQLLRAIGVCDGNLEEGNFRCDVNVSLRPKDSETLGTRVEIKNINSFRYVQMAIEYEIARQSECLTRKEPIVQETRLFDIQGRCTRAMRLKESAQDYRYFPEPDLPEIYLKDDLLRTWCAELPETPAQKRTRYQQSLGLSLYDARVLTEDDGISDFFELALSRCEDAKAVANWTMNEVLRYTKEVPIANLNIKGEHLGELVNLLNKGTIHGKTAKDIFARMLAEGGSPEQFVPSHDITYSEADLVKIVAETLEEHAEIKARYLAGKTNVLGFLIGVVMEKTQKQPHPKTISRLLREALEKSSSE